MLLDIVILPSVNLRKRIGTEIQRATRGLLKVFVVDNKQLIPHLSLWHIRTPKARINKIAEKLNKITRSQKAIKIRAVGLNASKKHDGGGIQFSVKNNKALTSFRKKVFKSIYNFKTGMMPPFKAYGIWQGKMLQEAKKYGRPLGFNPHFTMGLLKRANDAEKVKRAMGIRKFKFLAKEVYICEINKQWQVTKIIKRIRFG